MAFVPGLEPSGAGQPLLVVVRGLEVLVEDGEQGLRPPDRAEVAELAGPRLYLGQLGQRPCFGAALASEAPLPAGLRMCPARQLITALDPAWVALVGHALAVVEWSGQHRYCGRCAVETEQVPHERARRCPRCQTLFYPRIAPAVIVLVRRDDELLLARNVAFPPGRFSLLAGFVEVGESLEDAGMREVHEEVGITVTDLRYWGSQPWPYGRSLMIGFSARYASGELRADGTEIVEAGWFRRDRLPDLPPAISIARKMIDAAIRNQ